MPAMTNRHWRKKAVLFKIEAAYGVDPVPSGGANAVEVRSVSFVPLKNKMLDQNLEQAFMGNQAQIAVSSVVTLGFDIAFAGSGAAGTAPAYGPMLRACGFSETISAGVSVVYAPVSAAFESATIYINIDGVNHKLLGCRGNVDIKLPGAGVPVYSFSFTGLYGGVADTALPALTLAAWQTPLAVNNANTGGFALHGFATNLYGLDISCGANIVHRDDVVGIEDVLYTDRKMAGNITIQAPTVAEKDFFAIAKAYAEGALSVLHGTVAGNKVQLDAPAVQLIDPAYEDKNGIAALKMGLRVNPTSAGNDELAITVK